MGPGLGQGWLSQCWAADDLPCCCLDPAISLQDMLKQAINAGTANLRSQAEPAVERWWQEQRLAYAVDGQSTDFHSQHLTSHAHAAEHMKEANKQLWANKRLAPGWSKPTT